MNRDQARLAWFLAVLYYRREVAAIRAMVIAALSAGLIRCITVVKLLFAQAREWRLAQ